LLKKPFLLIDSPVFLQDVPVSIQEEELAQEELFEGVIVEEALESSTIDSNLIFHQLRFLARNNRFSRPLKIKLHNLDEIIGHIVSLEGALVTIEINGTREMLNGNDILKIEKF
jgi:hypothetical protein